MKKLSISLVEITSPTEIVKAITDTSINATLSVYQQSNVQFTGRWLIAGAKITNTSFGIYPTTNKGYVSLGDVINVTDTNNTYSQAAGIGT